MAYSRFVLFPNFLPLWLRVGVEIVSPDRGRASAKGLENRILLAPVSADWGVFLQNEVVQPKNAFLQFVESQIMFHPTPPKHTNMALADILL